MKETHIGIITSLAAHICVVPLLFGLTMSVDSSRSRIMPVTFTVLSSAPEATKGFRGSTANQKGVGRERNVIEGKIQAAAPQPKQSLEKVIDPGRSLIQKPLVPVVPQPQTIVADTEGQTVVSGVNTASAIIPGTPGVSQRRSTAGAMDGAVGGTQGGTGQAGGIYVDGVFQEGKDFSTIRDAIIKNVRYPERARRMGFEGRVLLSFVVLEDGSTAQIRLAQSSGFRILDEEARNVIARTRIVKRVPYRSVVLLPVVYSLRQPTGNE